MVRTIWYSLNSCFILLNWCIAVEKAIDLHATRVIGSSGYQKVVLYFSLIQMHGSLHITQCISYLWKGWLVQDSNDPTQFTNYKEVANKSYWAHFEHDRLRGM